MIHTCTPADPQTKGGSEASVRIAKADLVPTNENLLEAYDSFAELSVACREAMDRFNSREHRETRRIPNDALRDERLRLHVPSEPHTLAFGQSRTVDRDSTIRYGSARYRFRTPSSANGCGCEGRERATGSGVHLGYPLEMPARSLGANQDGGRGLARALSLNVFRGLSKAARGEAAGLAFGVPGARLGIVASCPFFGAD